MTWRHEKPILLIDQCHHTVTQLESENKRLFGLKMEFCNSVKFYVILDNILRQNFS